MKIYEETDSVQDTVLHASAGLGDVELMSFFMGYGVEAALKDGHVVSLSVPSHKN